MKTELEKYEAVNQAESLKALADTIRSFADDNGKVTGRERFFEAEKMAKNCESFNTGWPTSLTRNYGIRQQAIMLRMQNKAD